LEWVTRRRIKALMLKIGPLLIPGGFIAKEKGYTSKLQ
jgi:hypothetical protein